MYYFSLFGTNWSSNSTISVSKHMKRRHITLKLPDVYKLGHSNLVFKIKNTKKPVSFLNCNKKSDNKLIMLHSRQHWILTCMKLVIELIKCCGDFGTEFSIDIFYGMSMFLKQYNTKLSCMVGQLVYVCIVCIMCTWYPSNAQKNIIMLFLNL